HIISTDENPSYKIAWLLPVAIFPVFGAMLFLFFKLQPTVALTNKILRQNIAVSAPCLKQDKSVRTAFEKQWKNARGFVNYMNKYAGYPVCANTEVKYFALGDDLIPALLEELEKAEKYIFMEYFIIDRGEIWGKVLEVLKRKAAQGVEVRLMYDGLCSVAMLPHNYPRMLADEEIACRVFNPIRPFLSSAQNNRDHRKICVIDGNTAFTGGINLADEYANIIDRFGHWKDTAVMLKGDAVNNLTMMFLQMWHISDGISDYDRYMSKPRNINAPGFVLPYGDSPLDNEPVGKTVYMHILNTANNYVHIMTPYLILDYEMEQCLIAAAKRGVDVTLILPHKPDKLYAFYLAHAHYPALLKAGVKIYEYSPGFVHAKNYTSDDKKAVVGTINMDFRSLYLHWECACYMYDTPCVKDIEQDFKDTLKQCQRITEADLKNFSLFEYVFGKILSIFAPLM
ncbi:MAG: cardiolipin synthase, partial [Firmicutes bacterium]|nr:cardiolipin synthase [Bacillota bacterium]